MLPSTPVARLSPPINSPKDDPSKISLMAEKRAHHSKVEELAGQGRGYVSIDIMLPDELLFEIFYFTCVDDDYKNRWYSWKPTWERLVHVCRRWRYIVFAGPRRLDLRLVYQGGRPVDRMWDVWPALPIVIQTSSLGGWFNDNIIAAFKHNDRISEIYIDFISEGGSLELGKVMQGPYPALTDLKLSSFGDTASGISDSFLGVSQAAPRLRSLDLHSVAFPALPKLLVSSTGLVCLSLWEIPARSYFSAEAMLDCLSSMMDLEKL